MNMKINEDKCERQRTYELITNCGNNSIIITLSNSAATHSSPHRERYSKYCSFDLRFKHIISVYLSPQFQRVADVPFHRRLRPDAVDDTICVSAGRLGVFGCDSKGEERTSRWCLSGYTALIYDSVFKFEKTFVTYIHHHITHS